jgi:YfiH family protein
LIRVTDKGVTFLQFSHLAACSEINHGIFTRNSGHSKPPYNSLNVSHGVGDNDKHVEENRRIVAQCIRGRQLVFADQVHGRRVLIIGRQDDPGADYRSPAKFVGDAMVTDIAEKFLVIQVADCQAVLLYEPVRQVVANVHCGWRGSIGNIIGRTVDVMKQHFGCSPGSILAGFGPSLGPCCAEFIHYETEIPMEFWRYKDASDHFDFWSISREQLMRAGVPEKNLESIQICTCCHGDDFFSYRAEKTTGRFAAVIGLKEKRGDAIGGRS